MVMLKLVLVFYSYCIVSAQMSVATQNSVTSRLFYKVPKKTGLDFQAVLKENNRAMLHRDKCPLRINGGVDAGRSSVPYQPLRTNYLWRRQDIDITNSLPIGLHADGWWEVAIRKELRAGRHWVVFCGGAIITQSYVLTAVHCFDSVKMKKIIVVAGAEVSDIFFSGNFIIRFSKLKKLRALESWRKIKTCHFHTEYDKLNMINDFAVLEVNKPFIFSNDVQAVKILSYDVEEDHNVTLPESTSCVVSGYGLMQKKKTKVLQMVCLPLVNLSICEMVYPNRAHPDLTQICAGNDAKHSCPGDSGGPMVCKGFLVGIVSYGGEPGKVAGVYTFLRGYTDKNNPVEFYSCNSITLYYSLFEIIILLALTRIYHIFILFIFL